MDWRAGNSACSDSSKVSSLAFRVGNRIARRLGWFSGDLFFSGPRVTRQASASVGRGTVWPLGNSFVTADVESPIRVHRGNARELRVQAPVSSVAKDRTVPPLSRLNRNHSSLRRPHRIAQRRERRFQIGIAARPPNPRVAAAQPGRAPRPRLPAAVRRARDSPRSRVCRLPPSGKPIIHRERPRLPRFSARSAWRGDDSASRGRKFSPQLAVGRSIKSTTRPAVTRRKPLRRVLLAHPSAPAHERPKQPPAPGKIRRACTQGKKRCRRDCAAKSTITPVPRGAISTGRSTRRSDFTSNSVEAQVERAVGQLARFQMLGHFHLPRGERERMRLVLLVEKFIGVSLSGLRAIARRLIGRSTVTRRDQPAGLDARFGRGDWPAAPR